MKIERWTLRDVPLLAGAFVTVGTIRLLLWIVPMRVVQRRIDATPLRKKRLMMEPLRIGRAVTSAGHRIPQATCLPRALATQYLLRRRGIESELHLGVARSPAGKFEAHAWVTIDGQTIVGEVADRQYTPLRRAS